MYSGKMVYDVLDKDGELFVSNDYDTATKYMNTNFDTLAGRIKWIRTTHKKVWATKLQTCTA